MKKLLSTLIIAAFLLPNFVDAARLWSSGAELNSVTTGGVEFFVTSGAGCTVESTGQRSGTYGMKCTSAASTRQGFVHQFASAANAGPFYARVYLYVDTLPNANNGIMAFSESATISGAFRVGLYMESDGQLVLFEDAATAIGSPSTALNTGQWYMIELLVNNVGGAGGGNDEIRAYIDGVEFAGTNAATVSANYLAFKWGSNLLNSGSVSAGTFFYDDVAINDSTGSAQTSRPGSGKIVHCRPNAAGDSAATSGLFSDVDEVTPNDATDFIHLDTDGGMTAEYNIDDASTCGIDSYDAISAVLIGTRQRAETAAAMAWVPRFKTTSGTYEGTSTTHDDTTWRTNGDAVPTYNYKAATTTDADGTALTPLDIDSAQIGVRTTDSNPDSHFSAIWALVEFTDGTPPASGDAVDVGTFYWGDS